MVWIRAVLALAGVRVLSLNAYKVRLQKTEGGALGRHHGGHSSASCATASTSSDYLISWSSSLEVVAFAWHGRPLARCVYEGKRQALENPLAGDLFAIPGVAEVILDGHEIEVCKCPLRAWREMAPAIARRLANVSDARHPGH